MNLKKIGFNNLLHDAKGRLCVVKIMSNDAEDIRIEAISGPITTLPFSGIKLNAENLKSFGFISGKSELDKKYLPIPKLCIEFHAVWFMDAWVIEIHNHIKPIVTDVEFLHELQNLHFGFTMEYKKI